MSIHAISGKPGGGKSMYSVKMILDELLYGHRVIITNVPLLLGNINEYLQKNYPHRKINLGLRIRLLDDDQAAQFWTYRPAKPIVFETLDIKTEFAGGWIRIPKLDKKQWENGERPSYSAVEDNGVMYVIDEIHNFFNARAWMETGRDVLFYLSQHRKLGDTVIWITQAVANVDKQFRSVTQDYTYLRNISKEKMGLFRLPSMFVRKTYGSPATDTSQPMETGTFKLDVAGLGQLYDTAAGVGIHGKGADTSERKKGVHWSVFVIAVPVLLFCIYKFVPGALANYFSPNKRVERVQARSVPQTNTVRTMFQPELLDKVREVPKPPPIQRTIEKTEPEKRPVYFLGTSKVGDVWTVFLSDGRTFKSNDGFLRAINFDHVVIGNSVYERKPIDYDPQKLAATRN